MCVELLLSCLQVILRAHGHVRGYPLFADCGRGRGYVPVVDSVRGRVSSMRARIFVDSIRADTTHYHL
jgi:hypothetical protein